MKLLLNLLLLTVLAAPAGGATFVLDATGDAGDTNPGDGVCDSILAGTDCTLRAAIQEANALPGLDTIELPTLLYTVNIPGSDDAAAVGDLDVTDDLVVRGVGSPTVNSTFGDVAFELRSGTLRIENIALDGGGVRTLTGTRSTLRELAIQNASNTALINSGTMNAQFVDLTSNTGLASGAIDNSGALSLSNSLLSSNTALGSADSAGAILNQVGATLHAANVRLAFNENVAGSATSPNLCAQAIVNRGSMSLSYVSLIGGISLCIINPIPTAGQIANAGNLETRSSILSYANPTVCVSPVVPGIVPLQSRGYNTIEDTSCLAATTTGDDETGSTFDGIPPALCPLSDRGGWISAVAAGEPTCYRGDDQFYPFFAACNDGLDNDGDGHVDLQDPGCRDGNDPSEGHLRPGDFVIANFDLGGLTGFDPQTTRLFPLARFVGRSSWDVLMDDAGDVFSSDVSFDALGRVDVDTGAASLITAGGAMSAPTGLAWSALGSLLSAQNTSDDLLEIEPATGAQTFLLNDPSITDVDDLLLDPTDGSLLVADPTNGVFRISDPLGSPSVSSFATSVVQQARQLVFDAGGDIILADDLLNAPIRLDPLTSTDTALVAGSPFSSLQGAGAEPSGLFLFTDFVTGEIVRIDDATDTATVLNVGREEPGLNHLSVVPTPATVTVSLTEAIVIDGGTTGVADIGDTLELTAVVTNSGGGAADGLSFESGLDPNLTLVAGSLSTTQGTIVEGSLASDPRLEVDLGSLAPAATATVTWQVDVADPAPARAVSANAWVRREKIILAESDDPTTGLPTPDPNVIPVGDYGIVVQAVQKISDTRGGLSGPGNPGSALLDGGEFGFSIEPVGDLDGDGVTDVAVGAETDGETGVDAGAFYLLLMNSDGTVKQRFKYAASVAGAGTDDRFGSGIAFLGDLDAGGPSDFALAVSAWDDDGAGTERGAFYVLFLDSSPLGSGMAPTVNAGQTVKVADGLNGFPAGQLSDSDFFGSDLENIGDVDGDGVTDLAVGHHLRDDGVLGTNSGGVWILFMNSNGTVKDSEPLIPPSLMAGDLFGIAIAPLGFFDGDAVPDIAVGASTRGGQGAVFVLTLNADGTIKTETEIAPGVGGMPAGLIVGDERFGRGLEVLPDLDGDGTLELLAGAQFDGDAGLRTGAVYVVYLTPSGTTDRVVQLAPQPGLLFNELDDDDRLGIDVASPGDLDGDGNPEILVGAILDDDGGSNRGAIYVMHTATPVPEPSATLGLLSGIAFLATIGRKRSRC